MIRALDKWFIPYLRHSPPSDTSGTRHLLIAVCDHFEPFHDAKDRDEALSRVVRWRKEFPALTKEFVDSDGAHPAHSFFYPIEQYDEGVLTELASICEENHTEVEIHFHHNDDSAENVRDALLKGIADFRKHNVLPNDPEGNVRYAFIHGNWALDNSHPEGQHCGVDNELRVLRDTGCYADLTFPSAPDPSQPPIVNSIYYAREDGKACSHHRGTLATVGETGPDPDPDTLLIVNGPLGLNWERRKWGLVPRIENAEVSGGNPPRPDRLRIWSRLGIHVAGRPDWLAIKLHTHGGVGKNMKTLLAEPMAKFYRHLAENYNDGTSWQFHYVTARELVNIIHAAEAGHTGNPGDYRNFRYTLPGS